MTGSREEKPILAGRIDWSHEIVAKVENSLAHQVDYWPAAMSQKAVSGNCREIGGERFH